MSILWQASQPVREDARKKEGGGNPWTTKKKFFFLKLKKKITKTPWTTKLQGGGFPDLSGQTTKNTLFYVCLP